jgi:CheY-like chemotaxis protein
MLTILIIEDNEDDAFLLRAALNREGINSSVHLVANGKEGVRYLLGEGAYADRVQSPLPDVIFTDLNLPIMSGFDVLSWLKGHPELSVLPTMVISASNRDEDIQKAYQLGANAYLIKPGSLAQLQKIIRAAHDFWSFCVKPRAAIQSIAI